MWLAAYKARGCLHVTVSALFLQLSRNKWLCTCLQTLTLQSREACSTRAGSETASINSWKSTKWVDVCDTINIMTVNVFLLGMQPKEAFVCLHKVVSPSLHTPSPEFFSKQGNKKQILQIYLFLLFDIRSDKDIGASWVQQQHMQAEQKVHSWIPEEKVGIFCAV